MKVLNCPVENVTIKQNQREILLRTKGQYMNESNILVGNATIKQQQRWILLNIQGQYMKELDSHAGIIIKHILDKKLVPIWILIIICSFRHSWPSWLKVVSVRQLGAVREDCPRLGSKKLQVPPCMWLTGYLLTQGWTPIKLRLNSVATIAIKTSRDILESSWKHPLHFLKHAHMHYS